MKTRSAVLREVANRQTDKQTDKNRQTPGSLKHNLLGRDNEQKLKSTLTTSKIKHNYTYMPTENSKKVTQTKLWFKANARERMGMI